MNYLILLTALLTIFSSDAADALITKNAARSLITSQFYRNFGSRGAIPDPTKTVNITIFPRTEQLSIQMPHLQQPVALTIAEGSSPAVKLAAPESMCRMLHVEQQETTCSITLKQTKLHADYRNMSLKLITPLPNLTSLRLHHVSVHQKDLPELSLRDIALILCSSTLNIKQVNQSKNLTLMALCESMVSVDSVTTPELTITSAGFSGISCSKIATLETTLCVLYGGAIRINALHSSSVVAERATHEAVAASFPDIIFIDWLNSAICKGITTKGAQPSMWLKRPGV